MPQSFNDIKERVALGVRILAHQGVFPLALGHVAKGFLTRIWFVSYPVKCTTEAVH